jgi:regulatory protein
MAEESARALVYAYKLLAYRQRSVKELRDRLKRRGFGPRSVDNALAELSRLGYVDDAALARTLGVEAGERKLLGEAGARRFLMGRGVSRETADEALRDYEEEPAAARLVERKRGSFRGVPPEVARRRLLGYLRRRGFSGDTIKKAVADALGRCDGAQGGK